MTSSLRTTAVRDTLDRLFADAAHDDDVVAPVLATGILGDVATDGTPGTVGTAAEQADALAGAYLPISAAGGELLYSLTRSARPATVVEFGTSFGISTLYLAAAVHDNGTGHVYGSELSASKLTTARDNLRTAGLGAQVTLLAGDARESLSTVPGPIGLLFLDGWKDLCLPVLRLLEPRLASGALVVADDTSMESMADYLAYVREPANGYVTTAFPVEDGMEISCRA